MTRVLRLRFALGAGLLSVASAANPNDRRCLWESDYYNEGHERCVTKCTEPVRFPGQCLAWCLDSRFLNAMQGDTQCLIDDELVLEPTDKTGYDTFACPMRGPDTTVWDGAVEARRWKPACLDGDGGHLDAEGSFGFRGASARAAVPQTCLLRPACAKKPVDPLNATNVAFEFVTIENPERSACLDPDSAAEVVQWYGRCGPPLPSGYESPDGTLEDLIPPSLRDWTLDDVGMPWTTRGPAGDDASMKVVIRDYDGDHECNAVMPFERNATLKDECRTMYGCDCLQSGGRLKMTGGKDARAGAVGKFVRATDRTKHDTDYFHIVRHRIDRDPIDPRSIVVAFYVNTNVHDHLMARPSRGNANALFGNGAKNVDARYPGDGRFLPVDDSPEQERTTKFGVYLSHDLWGGSFIDDDGEVGSDRVALARKLLESELPYTLNKKWKALTDDKLSRKLRTPDRLWACKVRGPGGVKLFDKQGVDFKRCRVMPSRYARKSNNVMIFVPKDRSKRNSRCAMRPFWTREDALGYDDLQRERGVQPPLSETAYGTTKGEANATMLRWEGMAGTNATTLEAAFVDCQDYKTDTELALNKPRLPRPFQHYWGGCTGFSKTYGTRCADETTWQDEAWWGAQNDTHHPYREERARGIHTNEKGLDSLRTTPQGIFRVKLTFLPRNGTRGIARKSMSWDPVNERFTRYAYGDNPVIPGPKGIERLRWWSKWDNAQLNGVSKTLLQALARRYDVSNVVTRWGGEKFSKWALDTSTCDVAFRGAHKNGHSFDNFLFNDKDIYYNIPKALSPDQLRLELYEDWEAPDGTKLILGPSGGGDPDGVDRETLRAFDATMSDPDTMFQLHDSQLSTTKTGRARAKKDTQLCVDYGTYVWLYERLRSVAEDTPGALGTFLRSEQRVLLQKNSLRNKNKPSGSVYADCFYVPPLNSEDVNFENMNDCEWVEPSDTYAHGPEEIYDSYGLSDNARTDVFTTYKARTEQSQSRRDEILLNLLTVLKGRTDVAEYLHDVLKKQCPHVWAKTGGCGADHRYVWQQACQGYLPEVASRALSDEAATTLVGHAKRFETKDNQGRVSSVVEVGKGCRGAVDTTWTNTANAHIVDAYAPTGCRVKVPLTARYTEPTQLTSTTRTIVNDTAQEQVDQWTAVEHESCKELTTENDCDGKYCEWTRLGCAWRLALREGCESHCKASCTADPPFLPWVAVDPYNCTAEDVTSVRANATITSWCQANCLPGERGLCVGARCNAVEDGQWGLDTTQQYETPQAYRAKRALTHTRRILQRTGASSCKDLSDSTTCALYDGCWWDNSACTSFRPCAMCSGDADLCRRRDDCVLAQEGDSADVCKPFHATELPVQVLVVTVDRWGWGNDAVKCPLDGTHSGFVYPEDGSPPIPSTLTRSMSCPAKTEPGPSLQAPLYEGYYVAGTTPAQARAAALTGRWGMRALIEDSVDDDYYCLPDGAPTIAHLARRRDYKTGWFGRWDLGADGPGDGLDDVVDVDVNDETALSKAAAFLLQKSAAPQRFFAVVALSDAAALQDFDLTRFDLVLMVSLGGHGHGKYAGSTGWLADGGVRAPAYLRHATFDAGRDAKFTTADLYPTLLDLFELSDVATPLGDVDGVSVLPQLRTSGTSVRRRHHAVRRHRGRDDAHPPNWVIWSADFQTKCYWWGNRRPRRPEEADDAWYFEPAPGQCFGANENENDWVVDHNEVASNVWPPGLEMAMRRIDASVRSTETSGAVRGACLSYRDDPTDAFAGNVRRGKYTQDLDDSVVQQWRDLREATLEDVASPPPPPPPPPPQPTYKVCLPADCPHWTSGGLCPEQCGSDGACCQQDMPIGAETLGCPLSESARPKDWGCVNASYHGYARPRKALDVDTGKPPTCSADPCGGLGVCCAQENPTTNPDNCPPSRLLIPWGDPVCVDRYEQTVESSDTPPTDSTALDGYTKYGYGVTRRWHRTGTAETWSPVFASIGAATRMEHCQPNKDVFVVDKDVDDIDVFVKWTVDDCEKLEVDWETGAPVGMSLSI